MRGAEAPGPERRRGGRLWGLGHEGRGALRRRKGTEAKERVDGAEVPAASPRSKDARYRRIALGKMLSRMQG